MPRVYCPEYIGTLEYLGYYYRQLFPGVHRYFFDKTYGLTVLQLKVLYLLLDLMKSAASCTEIQRV